MATTTPPKPGPKTRAWLVNRIPRIATVRSFGLSNGFVGRDCQALPDDVRSASGPWGWLVDDLATLRPTIRYEADGTVHVRYHSNRWLEIHLRPEAA